jgi:hypothetical protein
MSKECLLLKISSNYVLKSIISQLEYNSVLKLVKYNKRLQRRLNISIKDYSLDYEIRRNITETLDRNFGRSSIFKKILIGFLITRLLFKAYQCVLAGLFILLNPYKEIKLIKEGFEKQKKFLLFLEQYMLYLIMADFFILLILGVLCKLSQDYYYFFFIAIFIDAILQLIAFSVSLWILSVLYNDFDYNWFRVYYIVYIIIIVVYIICLIACLIISVLKFFYKKNIESFITKFQGIKIKDYKIDEKNFSEMEPQEKKEYLLSSSSKMTFETNDQLVRIINAYRNKNYLSKLKYVKSFPEFILKGNSIVKFTFNNIINLENKKYLFRYPSGVFLQMLGEKKKILLIYYL